MTRISIPIGPQHPALKEPERFTIVVEGEKVVDADIRIGYAHRGIEKASESRNYIRNIYLIERICGICSHVHTTCYCQGVEELLGIEVPRRGLYIRTIVAELERIHSHMLWIGVAAHEIGFDTLFMYTWRDREHVLDILELISGNRVNYAMNTIGGVRRDLDEQKIRATMKAMDLLEKRMKYYREVAETEETILKRAENVGILPTNKAIELCAVGPTARASGVDIDVRRDDPYAAYGEIPFNVVVHKGCDVLSRILVRCDETIESCEIVKHALENLPGGDYRTKAKRNVPPGEVVSRAEAPRGEDIHYIRSNGTDKPERVKVRAPTLANIPSVVEMLKGGFIADVPIVVAGIDPCFSCTDRITIVSEDGRKIMDWEDLRRYGIEYYGGGK